MKRLGVLVLSGLVAGMTAVGWADETVSARPSVAAFDEHVAVCRRVVRQYCAIVQKMAPSPTADKAQQAEGLKLLAEARKQWLEMLGLDPLPPRTDLYVTITGTLRVLIPIPPTSA